jgi:hypothetical protein
MRKIALVLLFSGYLCAFSNAQEIKPDTIKGEKIVYKYLGIQTNMLLQQFISFNSNSSINTNPYLFTYSKNNIKTGRGIVFGTGFNISDNTSNDGVSSVEVQNINATVRYGFEKKYLQQEKFIPFWGVEFGAGIVDTRIISSLNQTFNSSKTEVEATKAFVGPSFRGGVNYALSKHILLGTEFLFNVQLAYTETSGTNGFSSSFVPFNIGFQTPTALFLIFKY